MHSRAVRWAIVSVSSAAALALILWAGLAAWFGPLPRLAGVPIVVAGLAAEVWFCVRLRPFIRAALACLAVGALLVLTWSVGLRPSTARVWQPDVAQTAYATFDGRKVTVHNVRDCHYRSATDFDVRYGDRTYDLDGLRSADLYLVDWGLHTIAHTMVSFGFADGQYLCFSIETRKEAGESYSAIKGFFRNYELIYVAADERDVVRLRTHFRNRENVYLYRLRPKRDDVVGAVFLEYLKRLNALHRRPEWYNALTDNCMTSAYKIIRKHAPRARWNWRILANGYAAELAHREGTIRNDIPFAEVKAAALVNERALATPDGADFSAAIRQTQW